MAAVECGLCGWLEEVDEELPQDQLEILAVKVYAEHMLEDHPMEARTDAVVRLHLSRLAQIIAPTNGSVIKKHG